MRIAEIFHSLQGEGKLTGLPSAFVRLAGCNLHCRYCDTRYALRPDDGREMSVAQIVNDLSVYPTKYTVITGGEPLLADELDELCASLRADGRHVTLETAATIDRLVTVDLASISPKLSNSTPKEKLLAAEHDRLRLRPEVIQAYLRQARSNNTDIQLKFVLEKPTDMNEVAEVLGSLEGQFDPADILLMPQAIDRRQLSRRSPWVADLCNQHGYRFCGRLQISLYGNRRGT